MESWVWSHGCGVGGVSASSGQVSVSGWSVFCVIQSMIMVGVMWCWVPDGLVSSVAPRPEPAAGGQPSE